MPKITVLPHPDVCPKGAVIDDAPKGLSICRILLDHDIEIEHACELSCACTTCHVVVKSGFDSLEEATDSEEDLLDRAWGLSPHSRLSCQALVADDDLTIEIPRYTINHAKESH
jgi:ferredoxin, 2Fe-2S